MSEWWSYRPSDFLLFSSRAYGRLVERHNAEAWPLHLVALAAGIAILVLLWRRPVWGAPAVAVLLALAWAFSGWSFHLQRYAAINWAAPWFAAAHGVQVVLLLVAAAWSWRHRWLLRRSPVAFAGFAIVLFGWPAVALLLGRPWTQGEMFGLMPDPTALATLALLPLLSPRGWLWLVPVPLAAACTGLMTQWLLVAPR
jgi:hypothetical protein